MTYYVIVDHKKRHKGQYAVAQNSGEGHAYKPASIVPEAGIGWSERDFPTAHERALAALESKASSEGVDVSVG